MSYIEEEKLMDAFVVDSEGYICGRVASFEVEPDRVLIKLYKEEQEEEEEVDQVRLKEELMLHLFGKVNAKLEKKLYNRIRKALNLSSRTPIGKAELVQFAKSMNLEVPTRKIVRKTREEVEEPVDLDLVACIGETPLGKCILLKEPWEARRRGLPLLDFVPYKSTEEVRGMMVIDTEARIVGHAERILIGKPLGLRIALETVREEEVVDFQALLQTLMAYFRTPRELYERLAKDLRVRPDQITQEDIIRWAEENNITVPKRRETKLVKENTLDIPWTAIKKIGDVILLKGTIEEIRAGRFLLLPSAPAHEAPPQAVEASKPEAPELKPLDLSESMYEE